MERRALKRLNIKLNVSEKESGELIGVTENFHLGGMMLTSMKPVLVGDKLDVIIDIPDKDNKIKKLSFMTQCCWLADNKNPILYSAGFRFIFPSRHIKEYIQIQLEGLLK